MRVLLVNPPLTSAGEVCPPLGLCALAGHLRRQQHDVDILDLDLLSKTDPSHHRRIFERAVRDFEPHVVGITSMFNNSLIAERLIQRSKEIAPQLVTVAGGAHFGALPGAALARIDALDHVVAGEGEPPFVDLVNALDADRDPKTVPGVWSRTCAEPPKAPLLDLETVPPLWETLGETIDLAAYRRSNGATSTSIYIEAGRGCPFRCSFCATAPFWDRRFRVKRPAVIVDDMRFLYEEHGYDTFMLVHDLPTVNLSFIREFSERVIETRLPLKWMVNNRPDIRLTGLIPTMQLAGCYKVFVGFESGSDSIQKAIAKRLSIPRAIANVQELLDAGITCTTSFVVGHPDETPAELAETLRVATSLKLRGAETVQIHRLRLWPPAPMTNLGLAVTFDEESVRLEYPFADVAPGDLKTIAADQLFFSGYFVPRSFSGTPFQLAQCERFFSYLIAAAPITCALIWKLHDRDALGTFYETVDSGSGVPLHANENDLHECFTVIEPTLRKWVQLTLNQGHWLAPVVEEVMGYEQRRVDALPLLDVGDEAWIETRVDLPMIIGFLTDERSLDADVLSPHRVRIRKTNAGYQAHVQRWTATE